MYRSNLTSGCIPLYLRYVIYGPCYCLIQSSPYYFHFPETDADKHQSTATAIPGPVVGMHGSIDDVGSFLHAAR